MKNMDELAFEEQQQYWEDEIALFGNYLTEEGTLKADTVKKHMERMQFVTVEYFVRYGLDYEQLQGETVVDFLGYFYISKMLNSSKSDVSAYLPSFKKWTQFLLQTGKISASQGAEVLEVCKHKEFFVDRFEQYMNVNSDRAMERWVNSNVLEVKTAQTEQKSSSKKAKQKPLIADPSLLEKWMDGLTIIPRIVSDFQVFLALLQETKNTKLTTARNHLPRSFWKELDEKLNWQLFRKPTLNQDQVPLFQFFFYVAVILGLVDDRKQKAEVTSQSSAFLALSEKEQAVVLLDALWNKVPWELLQECNEGGYPEKVQSYRMSIASVLASWPVDKQQDAEAEWKRNKKSGKLYDASTDVFQVCVVTILTRFDLVHAQYPLESEIKYAFQRTPVTMTVKESGMRVFRYFANEEVQPSSKPVSTTTKIGRNDPCPCGSGKKYKKCCL